MCPYRKVSTYVEMFTSIFCCRSKKKSQNHSRKKGKRLDKYAKKHSVWINNYWNKNIGTFNDCFCIIYFENTLTSTEIMKSSTALYTHYIIIHNSMARAIFRRCGCSKINDYGNKKETINRQLYIKIIISRTAVCAYTLLLPLLTPGMKPKLYSNKKKKIRV